MNARRLGGAGAASIALLTLFGVACTFQTSGAGAPAITDSFNVDGGTQTLSDGAIVLADSAIPTVDSASPGVDSGLACAPADVTSFTPHWVTPKPFHTNACPASQVSGYYSACFDPNAPKGSCATFKATNPNCQTCIESLEGNSTYGPVVVYSTVGNELNVGGCIAQAKGIAAGDSCSHAFLFQFECERAACSHCAIANQQTYNDYLACVSAADQGGCAQYTGQINSCKPGLSGTAAQCASFTDFKTGFETIAGLFCGP